MTHKQTRWDAENESGAAPPKKTSRIELVVMLLAAVAVAIGFSYWIGRNANQEPRGGLQVGSPMPELRAAGWLNGSAPSTSGLAGKVVVVNAWFTACPACHQQAPELVQLYNKYHERGVVFIGLTHEPPEMLEYVKHTMNKLRMTWTNGYGALDTLMAFDATYFPAYWVIGADGRVAWNRDSKGTLESAIDEALAAASPN